MKDMHSQTKAFVAIGAAELDADNSPPAVDLQGFDAAEVILCVGVGGITFDASNKIEFKLTHSDDNVSYEAVQNGDVLGVESVGSGGIIKALTEEHAAAAVYRFGYVGGKRYLKLAADFTGTHGTGTPMAAVVLGGWPHVAPVAAQA